MTKPIDKKHLIAPTVSLFTSVGTLVCCALPALMVTIGAGAALAGLLSNVPQLVWLSEYKEIVFAISGVMILVAGIFRWNSRNAPCPVDPEQAKACNRLRRWSSILYWFSVVIYGIGFFFAFFAAKVFF